jgi:hypothetical protein
MSDQDTLIAPRKRSTDVLKAVTDRPTREPAEHPNPVPVEPNHPVTGPRDGRAPPRKDSPR